jgi:tetratricopeptide (TPR) repeat protein
LLQDTDEAVAVLETSRRLGLADAGALAMQGDLYMNRNQPGEALALYMESFRKVNPPVTRMLRAVQGYLATGDVEKGMKLIDEINQRKEKAGLSPEQEKRIMLLEARAYYSEEKYEDARNACEALLEADPLNGDAVLLVGDIKWKSGAFEEALIHFERAERIAGKEVEALIRQAQVEVDRGKYKRAFELLKKAQNQKPQEHVEKYLEQVRRLIR